MNFSIRTNKNANHHLWNNNGWWCLNLTLHRPDYTKARVRRSLKTKDVNCARVMRDYVLKNGWEAL